MIQRLWVRAPSVKVNKLFNQERDGLVRSEKWVRDGRCNVVRCKTKFTKITQSHKDDLLFATKSICVPSYRKVP